jgi:hypothetical protein
MGEARQGHSGYSAIDFLEDVKCACAREGIQFDDHVSLGHAHFQE